MIVRIFNAIFVVTILLTITILPAKAGDFAEREIIGFSPDGNLFAFEQFGIQDGSGFAYSEIFVIDTNEDKWVLGSPFRVRIDEDNSTIEDARQMARTQASAALTTITDRGIVAATNRPDEQVTDPYKITVVPRSFFLTNNGSKIEFDVELLPLPVPDLCRDLIAEGEIFGFKLTRSGNNTVVMHEDKSIPATRKCPLDYKPADIVFHYTSEGKYVVAVLVRMESFGFEGRDGRYLAITGALN